MCVKVAPRTGAQKIKSANIKFYWACKNFRCKKKRGSEDKRGTKIKRIKTGVFLQDDLIYSE